MTVGPKLNVENGALPFALLSVGPVEVNRPAPPVIKTPPAGELVPLFDLTDPNIEVGCILRRQPPGEARKS